jgi:hypothetical protein
MANRKHLALLSEGVEKWNQWRKESPEIVPNLNGAKLSGANLRRFNFSWTTLWETNLSNANLGKANLRDADLTDANLCVTDFRGANLSRANLNAANLCDANLNSAILRGADLSITNLRLANLVRADLSDANLSGATLIETNLESATLTGAQVYGISVWDSKLRGALQTNLVITPTDQPKITVDNLEVAQFIYLLLNNAKIRAVIDTITSKVVLILGRFTPDRKTTLDALRDALRHRNYLPILFDFEKPTNRDFTETVSTLAHLASFVIADLTDPRSIPQELTAIVPHLLSVPVRPLLLGTQSEWGMFSDIARHTQVISPFHYTDDPMLLRCIETDIIAPAERKARELIERSTLRYVNSSGMGAAAKA